MDAIKIIRICDEIIQKTSKIHEKLKNRYTVISDHKTFTGYDFFIKVFEDIKEIYTKYPVVNSDVIPHLLLAYSRIDCIIAYKDDTVRSNSRLLYSDYCENPEWFELDRENKCLNINQNSLIAIDDTTIKLVMVIVSNGWDAIIKEYDFISASDALLWLKKISVYNEYDEKVMEYICDVLTKNGGIKDDE